MSVMKSDATEMAIWTNMKVSEANESASSVAAWYI